jgi:DNA-binding GntR family transcriptional regulator
MPGNVPSTAMPIERASASEQIANELRAQIEAGELSAGEPLPSDSELAKRFDVSKPTVTKARAVLVALGLVTSRAGAASIVRDVSRQPLPAGHHLQRARRTGRIYPEGHYALIVSADLTPASPEVAAALCVGVGSSVIERRRITRTADDTPLSTSTTYFPAELADRCPALLETERVKQGTTMYIEQQTGRAAASIAAAVFCKPAGDGSDALQLATGSYVLALSTTTYDVDGVALAYEIELHPPDAPITLDVITV